MMNLHQNPDHFFTCMFFSGLIYLKEGGGSLYGKYKY